MTSLVSLLAVASLWPSPVRSYGSGPPDTACSSMTPAHGQTPQLSSDNPYTLTVDLAEIEDGGQITVTLKKKSSGEKDFKGFFIQAVDQDTLEPVGEFGGLG